MIQFEVYGIPAPQGSKTPWGSEANKATKPWRAAVTAAAAEAMNGRPLLVGPLMLDVVFTFPRARHHFGTGRNQGNLKSSAPRWCAKQPDLDKLLRAVGDALTGVCIRDDALIVDIRGVKVYGEPAGVSVLLREKAEAP